MMSFFINLLHYKPPLGPHLFLDTFPELFRHKKYLKGIINLTQGMYTSIRCNSARYFSNSPPCFKSAKYLLTIFCLNVSKC